MDNDDSDNRVFQGLDYICTNVVFDGNDFTGTRVTKLHDCIVSLLAQGKQHIVKQLVEKHGLRVLPECPPVSQSAYARDNWMAVIGLIGKEQKEIIDQLTKHK